MLREPGTDGCGAEISTRLAWAPMGSLREIQDTRTSKLWHVGFGEGEGRVHHPQPLASDGRFGELVWNSLCRPGCPRTQKSTCLCLPSSGIKVDDPTPFDVQAEVTLKTNFFATRNVCTELLPIMKPHGRVVIISSLQGLKALENCSEDLQERFRCDALTEGDLVDLMKKFVEDTKNEVHEREGWPDSAYGVSKLGVTVLSRILARQLDEKRKADRILLNACCPGWVKTDMARDQGSRTVEEGAETPVYLALLPPDATEPHGQLIRDKVVQTW
ncbi:carbonyl reductase [NADPH] 3 isoform X2 [Apodemus sylvaticus]|uniref:carbonyl reductase [NADPH] 3 isoform X2 n=1 Tax=Apodemus sylvaticus TaxID=10129 RepID=UPI002244AE64|nr:carbonyl reductase [NADPH] 3 isoform X2 [Apodemus sylvaticus]